MNELMIIIFGLATVRTLMPLADENNWKLAKIILAVSMCWAFWHLLHNCLTITF